MSKIIDYKIVFIESYKGVIVGERITTAKVFYIELDNATQAADKYVEFQMDYSKFQMRKK